ncbi:MAG: hypothetical protein PHP97_01980 [Candidatus Shapirobacteria bacterium]|nr:hypothetical protein [Candidatus Shapirobacteria bacterium]MDD3003108.1 hypothetical protein [Candidatus Shapirobacteria bacterium]MDD4382903.1 hypothetical protein [Candidatus Shapirobacteria bacterium]
MSNLKKIILIIIGVVLLVLIFWLLFWEQNKNNKINETINQITISPIPTKTASELGEELINPNEEEVKQNKKESDDYLTTHPLWESLPYETDRFKISHYIKNMTLVVYVSKSENQEEIKELINKWIISKDINPPNHEIEFRVKD